MATTVGQHPVSNFTSPVNGDPLNADVVRSNDNTVRSAYVDHDADPGIHVQSSTLALRPAAGTAGRKWITNDTGVYTLWFDDGTNWHPVSSENVALTVLAGENLVKGDVVKVTGWNSGQDLPEVVKTTSVTDTAFAVITATVSTGAMGYATNTGIVQDVNTAAYSIGNILYANGTGGFTATKPTSGNYQPCAFVLRSNASNGVYYVEFSTPRIVEASANTASTIVARDASGNFSAGTITAALTGNASTASALQTARNINGTSFNGTADITVPAAAGTLTGATLASGVTASSLTSVGTLTGLTVSGNATVNGLRLGRGTGGSNTSTAFGASALGVEDGTGSFNTAVGYNALLASTSGDGNVAVGAAALAGATTGSNSTAVGYESLLTVNGLVDSNTSVGYRSLYSTTSGANNTAIGSGAGYGVGALSNTTGANNTFIGYQAVGASSSASNVITLGNSSIATLRCQVTTITSLSDARDKMDVVEIPAGLDFVKALQPRSFAWNMRDGGKVGITEFGFIAQELQQAQVEAGITVPGLVYDENPEKLEASAGVLIPVLVQAIKQLEARVAALEAV